MKIIREATNEDMNEVYMMGYDVWGDAMPSEEYVTICRKSSKYEKGQWYVLEDTGKKELLSSLIVYTLPPSGDLMVKGIGSIATPLQLRQKGYASLLVKQVIMQLEENENCQLVFLYSDIGTEFYKRLQFVEVPASKQRYQESTCMYYSNGKNVDITPFHIPEYF
ncbi:GNAT family N-acetyltransferase [Bacillaceae bacterium SAS-127]|nr:GNAT family N-acetyltransferase [Bacillaceae bacterium SAS-127]